MKKLLLGMGAVATIAAPISVVVSCGNDDKPKPIPAVSLATDLAKFKDLQSSKTKAALNTAVGTRKTGDDVTPADLGMSAPTLSDGVTATYKIATQYDNALGWLSVEVTLAKGSEKVKDNVKTFRVTASDVKPVDLATDLAKFVDAKSSFSKSKLNTMVGGLKAGDPVTALALGYTAPNNLSTGVTATYAIKTAYSTTSGQVTITVTLAKGKEVVENNTKDIVITADDTKTDDLSNLLAYFPDTNSAKNKAEMDTALSGLVQGATVTPQQLGMTMTAFPSQYQVSYVVTTPYDNAKGQIWVKATIKEGSTPVTNNTTDFSVNASDAAVVDLKVELDKISGLSTSTKTNAELTTSIGSKKADDPVTEVEMGYTLSTLSAGVSATFKIKTPYADNKVLVTITLTKDGGTKYINNSKDIILTAHDAPTTDVSDQLKYFINEIAAQSRAGMDERFGPIAVGDDVTALVTMLGYSMIPGHRADLKPTYSLVSYDAGIAVLKVDIKIPGKATINNTKNVNFTADNV